MGRREVEDAERAGKYARERGAPLSHNPYSGHTTEHLAWTNGWRKMEKHLAVVALSAEQRRSRYGINEEGATQLQQALETLAAFEGPLKHMLEDLTPRGPDSHSDVCFALRMALQDKG